MNDPHVVSLTYRVEHSDGRLPKSSTADGRPRCIPGRIDAFKVKIELVDHFATVEEACARVQPFLDAWELEADLKHPSDQFRFIYETAEVDRSPPPGVHQLIATHWQNTSRFHGGIICSIRTAWPEPPQDLELSFDADAMRRRWVRYWVKQGEPLLAAAIGL